MRREIREVLAGREQSIESIRPAPVATKPRRFGRLKVR
jgi:hypothetical protein